MSGNSKKQSRSRAGGWEEAGGEFYQELYPGGGAGTEGELFDNAQIATLLPSKQHRNTTTVKRVRSQNERRQSTFARTIQSRDVHLSMLPDLSENLSNEERTWEEIMQIKAMPVTMAQKRELKARLQNATKLRLQGLEQLHWRQKKVWHRFSTRITELLSKLELWQSPMRQIEGTFGTGVVSYFLFLRWLLFLNLAISILVILFLILPKILVEKNCDFTEPNSTLCSSYLDRNYTYFTKSNIVLDILQGTGMMEKTILFYGVYSNQTYIYNLDSFWDKTMYYNMPLAYLLVPISWALLSLISIVKTGAKDFKERLVESEGQFYKYCNLVFGGWDFCIRNDKSSKTKHKGIYNEVKWYLEAQRFKEEKQCRSRESQILLYFKRLMVNIIVLAILISSGVFIYFVIIYSMNQLHGEQKNYTWANGTFAEKLISLTYLDELRTTWFEFLPFLTIVILNIIVPVFFRYLTKFENYTPPQYIIVSLLRTVLLRLSSLAVLLLQIVNVFKNGAMERESIECWETYFGQQLYKLILTDFAVQFIMTFFINLPRAFIARHTRNRCLKLVGEQDFYLPKHVLDIVYTQTIIWMGTFYCPLLPIMGTIFYFIIFYVKKFTCLINCTPSPVVYRASKSKSLFMSVLLLGFIISMAPVVYSIAEIKPSKNCGPFQGLDTVWQFAVTTFEGFPTVLREIIFLLGESSFAVPAFAVLLFFLYYYWAVATANRHMVTVLKNQLVLEGHDKQFLLTRLSAFIRQHQKRCERRNRASFADDSSSIRQSSR